MASVPTDMVVLHVIHIEASTPKLEMALRKAAIGPLPMPETCGSTGASTPTFTAAVEQTSLSTVSEPSSPELTATLSSFKLAPRRERGVTSIAHNHTGGGHAGPFGPAGTVLEQTPDILVLDFLGRVSVFCTILSNSICRRLGRSRLWLVLSR